ncbi:MAG: ATP-binding cassette domain-containing protein [Chloroflexota bacterium]
MLQIDNLTKRYGPLTVLHQLSFTVHSGEVVGLAGRSSAGKSVLARILAGVDTPTQGQITLDHKPLITSFTDSFTGGFSARASGVEVIHQEPLLADNLDVIDNIFLGIEPSTSMWQRLLGASNHVYMAQTTEEILHKLDSGIASMNEKVANLSSEQRQLVAIARVMAHVPKVIMVDDPTTLLSYNHQQRLLSLIQAWQQQGIAVIFASNNLEHLFAVTDRIITIRRGHQVAEHRSDEVSREQIVAELVGATSHAQLTPAIWALDNYYRAREQSEKLRQKQALLEQDLAEQDTLNQQLVDQLGKQVAALDQANFALQDAQRRLLTEREQERKRLARELHDQVIQDLLSLNYELEELETLTARPTQQQLAATVSEVRADIRTLVGDVRRICGNLRPPTIDSLGLGAALQSYTRDWSERTGITVHLSLDEQLGRLPEALELSLFRIVQEGLSNVRKHAKADAVHISLKHTSPRTLMMFISDNGCGFAADFDLSTLSPQGHYGLLGISERVALLGGRLHVQNQQIETTAGRPMVGGAMIQVEIPHPRVGIALEPFT